MKVTYRGCVIDAHRAKSLGGDVNLYFSIFDGNYCVEDSFTSGSDNVRTFIGYLKEHVDDYRAKPWEYDGAPPARIQRSRKKGWRMPDGVVYVGRPTRFGNPFRIGTPGPDDCMVCGDAAEAVEKFRSELVTFGGGFVGVTVDDIRRELRGKHLACWCALDQPCHADVLLELANQ